MMVIRLRLRPKSEYEAEAKEDQGSDCKDDGIEKVEADKEDSKKVCY